MYCSPSHHHHHHLCSVAIRSNLLLQKGALPDKCNRRPLRRKKGKGERPLGALLAFPHSAHVAPTRLRRQRVALDPNTPGRYRPLHRRVGKSGIGISVGIVTGARRSLSRDRRRSSSSASGQRHSCSSRA